MINSNRDLWTLVLHSAALRVPSASAIGGALETVRSEPILSAHTCVHFTHTCLKYDTFSFIACFKHFSYIQIMQSVQYENVLIKRCQECNKRYYTQSIMYSNYTCLILQDTTVLFTWIYCYEVSGEICLLPPQ